MRVSVGRGVSVGGGVKVSDGMGEAVSVGMRVDVSAGGRLVNVLAGAGEDEAGTCLSLLQATRNRVKIIGRISFVFFMA